MNSSTRALRWPPIVERLRASAPELDRLYLVGGIVRDVLRGGTSLDVDLATPGDGLSTARHLADSLQGAYYPVDSERRTGRIILEDDGGQQLQIDIATFRGETLLEDLQGRDFTINAMAVRMDRLDALLDPLGGQDDLFKHRLLRQCTPESIPSDPVRALRAVRMGVQFRLRLHPETLAAVKKTPPVLVDGDGELHQPERCRDELFKMLDGPQSATALKLLHVTGLLRTLGPLPTEPSARIAYVEALNRLLTNISARRDDNSAANLRYGVAVMILDRHRSQLQEHISQGSPRSRAALLRLAAFTPEHVESWAIRLRLANRELATLRDMTEAFVHPLPRDVRAIHRYYRDLGEAGVDGVLLRLASALKADDLSPEAWGTFLDERASPVLDAFFRHYLQIVAPPPLLRGTDLMEVLGLEPSPLIGEILTALAEEQAAGTVTTEEQALTFAKKYTKR